MCVREKEARAILFKENCTFRLAEIGEGEMLKRICLVSAVVFYCSALVSGSYIWEQNSMIKRDEVVERAWEDAVIVEEQPLSRNHDEQEEISRSVEEPYQTDENNLGLDNSAWASHDDYVEDLDPQDNNELFWEGDSLDESLSDPKGFEGDHEEPESEALAWDSGEGEDKHDGIDCIEDHEQEDSRELVPQELPADVYSQAYVDALRKIGIENIGAGAKGITYSFYTSIGECKTPEDIQRDVSLIQEFEVIRIYDTDCEGLANILKSMRPTQKVFVGIHYPEAVGESVEIINQAVKEYAGGDWTRIHTVSIGNEMVNFGKATPADLEVSISRAKELLGEKGYAGPVVTTDTLVAVLNNRDLCQISDYIAVNSHPYWDGGVPAQQAGPWLESQLQMLDDVCERNGKRIFLAETGWPHKGKRFGQHGDPSKDNQLIAIKSIVDTLGPRTILFTTFNDYWKEGGSHDVEKFWGIFEN